MSLAPWEKVSIYGNLLSFKQWRSSQKFLGGAEDTLKNIRLLNSHYNAFIVLGRLWTSTSFCRLNNHREPARSSQHYRQAR
jgi:hypothetical protein